MSVMPNYMDPDSGGSALLDAINSGKYHLTKFILEAVDNTSIVNVRDFNGKTPLIRACYIQEERTRGRVIHLLLLKHADVNQKDDSGRTALSYACEMRCNDVVQILVKNNVYPDIADNKGNTPLIYCAKVGNDRGMEILLKSFRRLGLDVDRPNRQGDTALIISARHSYLECAAILAKDGRADIKKTDPETGMTAEEIARAQGCTTPDVLPFSTSRQRRRRRVDAHYTAISRSRTTVHTRKKKKADHKDIASEESLPEIRVKKSPTSSTTTTSRLPQFQTTPTSITAPSYDKKRYRSSVDLRSAAAEPAGGQSVYLGTTMKRDIKPNGRTPVKKAEKITARLDALNLSDYDRTKAVDVTDATC